MASINWNLGQRTVIGSSDTLECQGLHQEQIYGIFLYNNANAQHNIKALVTWSNSEEPKEIVVPGTTAMQGLASLALVFGNDAPTISVSIDKGSAAPDDALECWLISVSMPIDDPSTPDRQLPFDGVSQPFGSLRYHAVPPTQWCNLALKASGNQQFIATQCRESRATIFILNPTKDADARVYPIARAKDRYEIVKPKSGDPQDRISYKFQGDGGGQYIWMGADKRDTGSATIIAAKL